MAITQRDPGSQRFETGYDTHRLTEVVRIVAREANPADPEAATPGAYEAARGPAGFPDAPGARATRRALGNLSWYQLLHLAFHDERSLEHNLGVADRRDGRPVSEQEAVAALRIIAARLKANSLRPHEYQAELDALEKQTGPTGLPTEERIEAVLNTEDEMGWERGLRLAGLEPRAHTTPRRGVCREDAIEMFVEELSYVPNHPELKRYAKLKGFPLSRATQKHQESVEHARQKRLECGLPWPSELPARGKRPELNVESVPPETAQPPRGGRDNEFWNPERCIEGLVRAYDIASKRRLRLTQKVQRRLAAEFPAEIPGPSRVDSNAKQYGATAAQWREEAKRQRLRR